MQWSESYNGGSQADRNGISHFLNHRVTDPLGRETDHKILLVQFLRFGHFMYHHHHVYHIYISLVIISLISFFKLTLLLSSKKIM